MVVPTETYLETPRTEATPAGDGSESVTSDKWTRTDGCVLRVDRSGKLIEPNQSTRQTGGPDGKTEILKLGRAWLPRDITS